MKRPSLAELRQDFTRNISTVSAWTVTEYRRRPPIPADQRKNVKISKKVSIKEVDRILFPFGYLDDTDDEDSDIYVDDQNDKNDAKNALEKIMKSMGLPTSFKSSAKDEEDKENNEQLEPKPKRAKKSKKPALTVREFMKN